jgi:hypothetical protein
MAPRKATTAKKKPQAAAGTAQKKETLVYVGPNLSKGIMVSQFSTFRNGLPQHVANQAEADRDFARLFVPVKDLAAARVRIKTPGDQMAKAFVAVLKKSVEG